MKILEKLIKRIPRGYQHVIFRNYLVNYFKRSNTTHRYALLPNDYIGKPIILNGSYESDIISFIKEHKVSLFPNKGTFWDIGGKYGVFSVELNQLFPRIETFEPNKSLASLLRVNLNLNNTTNVQVHEFGLGEKKKNYLFMFPLLILGNLPPLHVKLLPASLKHLTFTSRFEQVIACLMN